MLKKVYITAVLISGLFLFHTGCGSARKTEPILPPAELTSEKLVKGEKNFYKYCNHCHPNGESGLGPALNNKDIVPGFLIKFQVRNGLGAMPAFPERILSSDDLDDIVEYIKYLQGRD